MRSGRDRNAPPRVPRVGVHVGVSAEAATFVAASTDGGTSPVMTTSLECELEPRTEAGVPSTTSFEVVSGTKSFEFDSGGGSRCDVRRAKPRYETCRGGVFPGAPLMVREVVA